MSKHKPNQITRVKEVPLSLLKEIIEETGATVNKVEPERTVIHFVIEYPSEDMIDEILGKGLSTKPFLSLEVRRHRTSQVRCPVNFFATGASIIQ